MLSYTFRSENRHITTTKLARAWKLNQGNNNTQVDNQQYMGKAQNRNVGRKICQGNTTPQKSINNIIKDLLQSEGNEFPVADTWRMMIRMFNLLNEELKENMQKQLNEYLENMD
jgi:hypothetical protein